MRGYQLWLISGDQRSRVQALAAELDIPPDRALFNQTPEGKASAVASIDRQDTLYLGDGVNDSLAFERALCAGTPAVDRPVVPGKADFFMLGEGLSSLRSALEMAGKLRGVVHRSLTVSLAYNAVAVTLCLAGAMSPLRAAIAMPLSSLFSIGLVLLSFRRRTPQAPWTLQRRLA